MVQTFYYRNIGVKDTSECIISLLRVVTLQKHQLSISFRFTNKIKKGFQRCEKEF